MRTAKRLIFMSLLAQILLSYQTYSQGWTASVTVDLNHNLYAFEKISSATVTFSGATARGSSDRSSLQLTLHGTGSITGQLSASASGLAWQPYDQSDPYSSSVSGSVSGTFTTVCSPGFLQHQTSNQQIHVYITVFPRMVITGFNNDCDHLSLSTTTCSNAYSWDVGESPLGPFKVIPGKSTSSIIVSREELNGLGFADPYGRKYFRVTGRPGTTSQLQAMDIYYPPPTASVLTTPPKCRGTSDGSATVSISSANANVINDFVITLFSDAALQNFIGQNFVNDNFTTTFSGLPAGSYWIKIENNSSIGAYGNCWAVYSVPTLADPPQVTIGGVEVSDFNGFNVKCGGGNEGTMRITPSGGTGTYVAYEWTPRVSTTEFAEHLGEGTYEVRVQDSNGCWTGKVTRTLTAPAKLSLQMISTGGKNGFDVSCLDKFDGRIETEVSGGIPGYSYSWSTGTSTSAIDNLKPGTYSLQVTDANACTASSSITLTAPAAIDFTIAEINGIICPGDDSGILEIQSTRNTIGQVYYLWSSGESTRDVRDKSSGTYSAIVSDGQGCSATKAYTLAEPDPWSLELASVSDYNGMPIRCHGDDNGKLQMVVRNGDGDIVQAQQYSWYRNGIEWTSGPAYSSLGGLTAGTYKGVITYNSFCTLEKTFTLNEPEAVGATISGETSYNGMAISCSGASDAVVRAAAAGGTGDTYTYEWSNGASGPELTGIGAGTYTVIARDVNGCEAAAQKILEDPEPVEASISVRSDFNGQPISCTHVTDARLLATARGGTHAFSYLWNTGQTGPDLSDVGAGSYLVTVTDLNGCQGVAETVLSDPEPVTAMISDRSDYNGFGVRCSGNEDGYLLCSATGGTGSYRFNWTGLHTQALYANLAEGTYSVLVTDQNGCTSTTEATLTAPPDLSLNVSGIRDVSCFGGNDGEIKVAVSGGAGGYRYAVDDQTWQSSPFLSGLKAGSHSIVVTDVNHCMLTSTQPLTEPSPLVISIDDATDALCGQPTGRITASVTGGAGNYRYEWTDSQNNILSQEADVSNLTGGVYRLNILDDHLCAAGQMVGITSVDGPEAIIDNIVPARCSYSEDGAAEVMVTQGHGPFNILWEDGQTTAMAANLGKGNHFVKVTDVNGCTFVEQVTIPAPDSLRAGLIEKKDPVCHGDCNGKLRVTAIGGSGPYNFKWDGFSGSEVSNLCAGTYKVIVTDERQCASEATFALNEPEAVAVSLKQLRDPVCHDGCDGQIRVVASGGTGSLHYEWSTGAMDSLAVGLCSGAYTVTVNDDSSCVSKNTYVLSNPPGESLDLGGAVTLCAGQSHTLDAGPRWREYSWSGNTGFQSSSQRVTVSEAGSYWLKAVSDKGCVAQDTFLLETSSNLLRANFLMTTEAMVMDTVVIIDVSWPLPETATWRFPEQMNRIEDFGEMVFGQFREPGDYEVSLSATLGECRDEITKTVTILRVKEEAEEGRLGAQPFVKDFDLYPNPNEGTFDVVVRYQEPSPMLLTVWSVLTARKIAQVEQDGKESYRAHFDLRPLSAGPYTLRLDYAKGTKYIRFIVR